LVALVANTHHRPLNTTASVSQLPNPTIIIIIITITIAVTACNSVSQSFHTGSSVCLLAKRRPSAVSQPA